MSADGGTKLFVYGVSTSCPRGDLEDHFAKFGTVSDVFVTGKGYAFVTMEEEDDAKAAVNEYNGTIFDGQEIKVEVAHGRGSTRRGGGRGFGGDRRGGGYGGDRRGYGGGGGGGGYSRGGGGRYGDREGGGRGGGRYGDREGGYRGGDRDGGSRYGGSSGGGGGYGGGGY